MSATPTPLGTRQLNFDDWLDTYQVDEEIDECEECFGYGRLCDCGNCTEEEHDCGFCDGTGEWNSARDEYEIRRQSDAARWRRFHNLNIEKAA